MYWKEEENPGQKAEEHSNSRTPSGREAAKQPERQEANQVGAVSSMLRRACCKEQVIYNLVRALKTDCSELRK